MNLNVVLHGDCLSTLLELYNAYGEVADLIVTSPPYAQQRKNVYNGIAERDYPDWMLSVVRAGMAVLKPSGSFVLNIKEHVNHGVRSLYVLETTLLLAKEFRFVDEFIWHKTNPFPTGNKKRLKDGFERCLHFTKTADYQFFPDAVRSKSTSKWAGDNERRKNKGAHNTSNGSGMNMSKRITGELVRPSNVITLPASSLNIGHPAVFPIGLPEFFIKLMTKEGDVVVDPFLGSGTTALAAMKLNRQYVGIERDEQYVRLAESRIAALSADGL
jgi:site-specific DNA-methyltransferase (adenine-specific)/site-specific DNA-methyltransferase (cytosine-N4-specific)